MKTNNCKLQLKRTLFNDFFRAQVLDENNEIIGKLLIIPGLPLDRSQLPPDAPEVAPYLVVVVEDAAITKDNLLDFEDKVSMAILNRFTTETTAFSHCEFYYPSPAFFFEDKNSEDITNSSVQM